MDSINDRVTPAGHVEGPFRRNVRYALDMDIFSRDDQIFEEIRRLRAIEEQFISASVDVANWKLERAAERAKMGVIKGVS